METVKPEDRRYIIWDPKDGYPRYDGETGAITSAGCLGVLGPENIYLTTYAAYTGNRTHRDLGCNNMCEAVFSLSGTKGTYEIFRVK